MSILINILPKVYQKLVTTYQAPTIPATGISIPVV